MKWAERDWWRLTRLWSPLYRTWGCNGPEHEHNPRRYGI